MHDLLKGVRVVEFARYWAGPSCARQLAEMGAEVIKVESPIGDRMRGGLVPETGSAIYPGDVPGERPYNRAGTFNIINRNKFAISIDLDKGQGNALFKKLVKISDIIIDNMVPGTLEKLGLGYETLSETNPGIIMCGITAFGATGPERRLRGLGVTIEPYGLASVTGYPGEDVPVKSGVDHIDPLASTFAVSAILAALIQRQTTKKGQFIDVSMLESAVCVIGQSVMEFTMNDTIPERTGNRDDTLAPHGCYQCQGEDKWITLAVSSEEEWAGLKRAMGNPKWANEERFATSKNRLNNQEALDKFIMTWSNTMDARQTLQLLQGEGVPAGMAMNTSELIQDKHLKERGFYETISHSDAGSYPQYSLPKLAGEPAKRGWPAPCFAEHNQYVFHDLLGLSQEQINDFINDGVIYQTPIRWVTRSLE